jgi:carbonic anhydrase
MAMMARTLVQCLVAVVFLTTFASVGEARGPRTRSDVLQQLDDGNKRFAEGQPQRPRQDAESIKTASDGKRNPMAIIVTCSDLQVPMEAIFDVGFGDLHVVRVLGNVVGAYELASLEQAIHRYPETPLIIVVGHRKCEIVRCAVDKSETTDRIRKLTGLIVPAIEMMKKTNPHAERSEDIVHGAIKYNVRHTQAMIVRHSEAVKARIREKKLTVYGAIYEDDAARISWVGQHPDFGLDAFGPSTPTTLGDDADLEPFKSKDEK